MAASEVQITLEPLDIPGADLSEPFDKHTVPQLHWWLLCRGIKVPTSWRKQQVIDRYVFLLIYLKGGGHAQYPKKFYCIFVIS